MACSDDVGPVASTPDKGPTGPKYGDLVFAVGTAHPINYANSSPVVHLIYIDEVHKATLNNIAKNNINCTNTENTLVIKLEEGEYKYRTVVKQGNSIYFESPVRTIRVTGGQCVAQRI